MRYAPARLLLASWLLALGLFATLGVVSAVAQQKTPEQTPEQTPEKAPEYAPAAKTASADAAHAKDGAHGGGHSDAKSVNPLELAADLGLWSLVVFVLLLLILRKTAWGPIVEGLQKREQTILGSVEEARKTREEMERLRVQFKEEMAAAHAQIPALMDEARRDAQATAERMRKEAAEEIETDRKRARQDLAVARDQALQELWSQAAQVATLISAKAIGRSLTEDDHRRLVDEAIAEIGQGQRNGHA